MTNNTRPLFFLLLVVALLVAALNINVGESAAFQSPISPLPTPTVEPWHVLEPTPTAGPGDIVPVELPEPASLALLGGGLVAGWAILNRRRAG